MPWEKSYTEEDVLEAVMRAFWAHGYQGTSMADLVAATGLNRGSLYAGFGGKRDLFLRALAHYDRIYRQGLIDDLRRIEDPRAAILHAFGMMSRDDAALPRGCLMVNSAMELAPHDPEIARIVEASMAQVAMFFADCLRRAGIGDTSPGGTAPEETARVLQGLLVGLLVLTRADPQTPAVAPILDQVRAILR